MTETVSRKELHTMIDTMPEQFIRAMVPLVTCIAEEYWKPVIEPADPAEIAMVEEREKDYKTNPSSWTNITDIT
jgi:isoleucyl-tRNA synthetase